MSRTRLDEDVQPLSEFRANVASFVERVRKTKRPVVLTQRGHSAAVLLDVSKYEQLLDEVETLRDIQIAEKQLSRGRGVSHSKAKARILAALRK
ncbi:MAG: type II toxin-antitoxin system Phd/YefM family antitoxin [Deltaproteobacteria bacterium]|nr:MAG: type II toxin-antitoxin system Phd/YefM family antitoxin [Deltaproteobacteria bacterium]